MRAGGVRDLIVQVEELGEFPRAAQKRTVLLSHVPHPKPSVLGVEIPLFQSVWLAKAKPYQSGPL